mmetsp:Transcript_24902/g.33162  ORF Transcript_24902/g.33162 Transcript_24902/m.33162 type:complete len:162 (+) Transcript_24902:148-633(+)
MCHTFIIVSFKIFILISLSYSVFSPGKSITCHVRTRKGKIKRIPYEPHDKYLIYSSLKLFIAGTTSFSKAFSNASLPCSSAFSLLTGRILSRNDGNFKSTTRFDSALNITSPLLTSALTRVKACVVWSSADFSFDAPVNLLTIQTRGRSPSGLVSSMAIVA